MSGSRRNAAVIVGTLASLLPAPWTEAQEATASEPVFTTYAAPRERSEYLLDQGYHLRFYDPGEPLALTTDSAGDWGIGFRYRGQVLHRLSDFARPPVVRSSYASFVRFDFEPLHALRAEVSFAVHSSRVAILELTLRNESDLPKRLEVYAFASAPESGWGPLRLTDERDGLLFDHHEPPEALSESPPPDYDGHLRDVLLLDRKAESFGGYPAGETAMVAELERGLSSGDLTGDARSAMVLTGLEVAPGGSAGIRWVRAVAPFGEEPRELVEYARARMDLAMEDLEREEERAMAAAPALEIEPERELIYRGALALARQSMLPAEGRTAYNYYVFSREPTWSWGHDGQVFHESLSMLAYAHLDPGSAMDSQRLFMEAQEPDGYIPYRMGPYVVRTFPVKGERTTSAPFYSWINWEVYRIARDRVDLDERLARRFLEDAYRSGARFTEFLLSQRDADGDGLLEWGGHAVLESVRDSLVPIWDLLGRDDPTAPSLIEALDLSTMVVQEMRSLAKMADELERDEDRERWTSDAETLARRIEETMWDEETGFYYNLDRETNRFVTDSGLDLRRMEIIGFLPLWAGVSSPDRAERLIEKLTDPRKFWRRFGVPTLAADDPGYQPVVTRCCQWNGAVWLEWDYLVFHGLNRYGYQELAEELGARMLEAAATQLRRNHRFWESYSPDEVKLGSPKNYIWNSILARVILDLESEATAEEPR